MIYELRWYHQVRRTTPRKHRARHDHQLRRAMARYNRIKRRIAVRLREAEHAGTLNVRPPLDSLIQQHVQATPCVFTTNWDRSLDRYLREHYQSAPPVIHLHGSSKSSKTLYLPSEVIEEPYRSAAENGAFGSEALRVIQVMQNCQRLVVYGLSFEPLDAELGVVVSSAADALEQIDVVDPNHKPVMERIAALVLPATPRIVGRSIEKADAS
jgi:hypothetical protein